MNIQEACLARRIAHERMMSVVNTVKNERIKAMLFASIYNYGNAVTAHCIALYDKEKE